MNKAMESRNLGPHQEKPRTFPNMRNKPYTLLIFRILMKISVPVLLVLVLLGLGAVFFVGAHTSLHVVHQPVRNTNDGKETLDHQYEVVRTRTTNEAYSQLDASLYYFWFAFRKAPEGSQEKLAAQKELLDEIQHRVHIDESMLSIAKILFGTEYELMMEKTGKLGDNRRCLHSMVRTYEEHCGYLSAYGLRYVGAMDKMCNAGVKVEQMATTAATVCHA